MERNTQKNGFINLVALLAVCAIGALMARYANSATGQVGSIFLGIGFLVATVSYFQMRLEERERLEKLEYDEMVRDRKRAALFSEAGEDTFIARRAREQFERFFVPAFTIVLLLLQVVGAYVLWNWLPDAATPTLGREAAITMVSFSTFALILFLLGKFSAGVARIENLRLLRPGGAYLLLGSVICTVVVLTEAAAWFEFANLDKIVARVLVGVLVLAACETLVNLVLEIYRPRGKSKAERMLYESRLVGLLGQPAGLITTAAQALDYQFGFKVSETWFYKFLDRAIAWLILIQIGMLVLSTTFVIIDPREQALLERFGQSRAVLSPGLHFKFPWPIDKVHRHDANQIQSFNVGYTADPDRENERTQIWTASHNLEEVNFLVASREQGESIGELSAQQTVPVNFLTAAIPIQYRINDLNSWVYNHTNPADLIERIGEREVVRYFANVDIDVIMSSGRLEAAAELKQRIQAQADEHQLGLEVLYVGLQDIHPPIGDKEVQVAEAFEQVIGAIQERESEILKAEAYAAEVLPKAKAEAAKLVNEAHAFHAKRVSSAEAEANQFKYQLMSFKASPSAYVNRKYLETMETALANVRKYVIVPKDLKKTFIMNLEDKVAFDLLDVRPDDE